jgi:hypothetical protein
MLVDMVYYFLWILTVLGFLRFIFQFFQKYGIKVVKIEVINENFSIDRKKDIIN